MRWTTQILPHENGGLVILPDEFVQKFRLVEGDDVEIIVVEQNAMLLKPMPSVEQGLNRQD